MPILRQEPSLYPADLFRQEASTAPANQWWALHTKPRQEKALARFLWQEEISFYLPLVARRHVSRGRKLESYVPLFPSYVFLLGTAEDRLRCLTTNRVLQALAVPDQKRLQFDLAQVHRLIETKAPLTLEEKLRAGQRVRVHSGVLMGLEGTVLARRRATRLVVAVQFLQQGVSVELDDCLLEPAD